MTAPDPRRTGYVGGSAYYEERPLYGPAPDEPRWSRWEWDEWRDRAAAQHAALDAWVAEHQDAPGDAA